MDLICHNIPFTTKYPLKVYAICTTRRKVFEKKKAKHRECKKAQFYLAAGKKTKRESVEEQDGKAPYR